jgi:hypothetical protein
MDIGAIIAWFQTNWVNIINIITGVIAVASIAVKLTPTIKDNEVLEKIIKFIGKWIALNRTVDDDAIRTGTTPSK